MPVAFHLLDLLSQAPAVQRLLRNLSRDEKLTWLSAHGKLTRIHIDVPDCQPTYSFESGVGLACIFFINGDDLVFVGDHTTYTVQD